MAPAQSVGIFHLNPFSPHHPSLGKSSLVIQFIENHFVDAYYPTIESTFSKGVVYQGVEYDCDIIDTAGQVGNLGPLSARLLHLYYQDEYSILNSKHAIGIHGYVLVYSVTSRRSFEMIKIVYDKILDFCGKNDIPCVIVGAKTDLQNRYVRLLRPLLHGDTPCFVNFVIDTVHSYSPNTRQVQPNEGEELAKSNKAAWVETSAKNNINVGTCTSSLVRPAHLKSIPRQSI